MGNLFGFYMGGLLMRIEFDRGLLWDLGGKLYLPLFEVGEKVGF